MRKLQQFLIYKFSTKRLKESNYNLDISIAQARKNLELVSLSDSELIRTIFRIQHREFSVLKLNELEAEKHITKKRKSSISDVFKRMDDYLFIPEIISLKIDNKSHFKKIINNGGFTINGKNFVPLIFSAGLIRRNSGLFILESIKNEVMNVLDNGRNKDISLVPAKYNSYLGLYSSASYEVSFPRIAVVNDLTINRDVLVDFGEYVGKDIDPKFEQKTINMEFNAFDGCGLVSPKMAKKWKQDLELDYLPSTFVIRSSWLKGMSVIMDFQKFGLEEAGTTIIKDVYGNSVDLKNIDLIVTPSMFKLWDSYNSTQEYILNCEKNNLGFGITKFSPKNEKSWAKASYQFLQVLDIREHEDIEELCKPTIDYINNVRKDDAQSALLYALGETTSFDKGWFDKIDPIYQVLAMENDFINDSYLSSKIDRTLSKKKHDAKKGNLLLNGNYQIMIPDMVLYCQHIYGIKLEPLLKEGDAFSSYWNERNVKNVVGIRSPLVYQGEVLHLKLKDDSDTDKWFSHITSGVILPANGITLDWMQLAGADADGDIICTIDSDVILKSRVEELPISFELLKPDKKIISENEDVLYDAVLTGLNTKIGFYTNVSSSIQAMLYNYDKNSKEYEALYNRLKWTRCLSGLEIDRQKGLIIPPFPDHWTKFHKILSGEDNKELYDWNNKILIDKRPYFFIYLYDHYMKRYRKEQSLFDNISFVRFGKSFSELLETQNRTVEQDNLISRYNRKTFFIDNDSVMNRISHYMEKSLDRRNSKSEKITFDYIKLMLNEKNTPSKKDLEKIKLLYKEYASFKRGFRNGWNGFEQQDFSTIEQVYEYVRRKAYTTINDDSNILGDWMVYSCYKELGNKSFSFLWNCFGREVAENVKAKRNEKFVKMPLPSLTGSTNFLFRKYGKYLISIE